MDNFNYQAYIKSGKIHGEKATLTEAQATGFGIGQGRSKTISKGKESNSDLKDTLKDKEQKKTKYFMKNGVPHKADGTPLKKMSNESSEIDESALAVAAGDVAQVKNEEIEEGNMPMYDEDDIDSVKEQSSKMRVSELKAKIKETILAELTLKEDEEDDREDDELSPEELANKYAGSPMREADEEVDVDIDVEDEVEVDAEADDIEIEKPGVKTTVNVGLSPEEEIVQDSLKAAMDAAQALGSDKLADQIGNTITFFTRQFVVGDSTD